MRYKYEVGYWMKKGYQNEINIEDFEEIIFQYFFNLFCLNKLVSPS